MKIFAITLALCFFVLVGFFCNKIADLAQQSKAELNRFIDSVTTAEQYDSITVHPTRLDGNPYALNAPQADTLIISVNQTYNPNRLPAESRRITKAYYNRFLATGKRRLCIVYRNATLILLKAKQDGTAFVYCSPTDIQLP